MIEYKCTKCKFTKQEQQESKTYSLKDLKSEKNSQICPECGSVLEKSCEGVSFKLPVYDLSYAKSYKRFQNGLHYDATAKDKERTAELNREMRHNNTQAQN